MSRQAKHIDDHGDFIEIAERSSAALLKTLVGQPLITQEIGYKIRQDLDSRVLISLKDFLKLPDIVGRGITEENVHQHLMAAALLIVFNLNSQSSKVCLCMDPSRQSRSTNLSVNDSFEVGWPHIPDIAENLIKFQFNIVNTTGDISNFYNEISNLIHHS